MNWCRLEPPGRFNDVVQIPCAVETGQVRKTADGMDALVFAHLSLAHAADSNRKAVIFGVAPGSKEGPRPRTSATAGCRASCMHSIPCTGRTSANASGNHRKCCPALQPHWASSSKVSGGQTSQWLSNKARASQEEVDLTAMQSGGSPNVPDGGLELALNDRGCQGRRFILPPMMKGA